MTRMKSLLDTASDDFRANDVSYREKVDELHALRLLQRVGGPEMARKRHVDKGKILPRERIERLIDPGTPFLELGELAGLNMHKGVPPGAGIITGIGVIEGRQCMIIANDATVKGGTYFGITCRKHVRAQKIAWKNRLPVITLVDSGGAFLPDQANLFPDEGQFGSIFHQQIGMSGDGVPQIAVVMGPCTAGGAYIPALCDEVVIVRGQGFMYLGGPELTFAATGEKVEAEELGGGKMHSSVSGVTDHLAEDDAHALAITREIVSHLGEKPQPRKTPETPRAPAYPVEEIYGLISRDPKVPTDNREIVARLVDESDFHEFKPLYGDTIMTGWGRIHGHEVGILANTGVLFVEAALKATHFINLCVQRDIPLLFLADVNGFMVGRTTFATRRPEQFNTCQRAQSPHSHHHLRGARHPTLSAPPRHTEVLPARSSPPFAPSPTSALTHHERRARKRRIPVCRAWVRLVRPPRGDTRLGSVVARGARNEA